MVKLSGVTKLLSKIISRRGGGGGGTIVEDLRIDISKKILENIKKIWTK